jgi:hypothetical protein
MYSPVALSSLGLSTRCSIEMVVALAKLIAAVCFGSLKGLS